VPAGTWSRRSTARGCRTRSPDLAATRCRHIDEMSNEHYQSLFAHRGRAARALPRRRRPVGRRAFVADSTTDDELGPLVQNLGGHDLGCCIDCYRQCDEVTDRPSVVFAYTVKGWGLPIAGDPLNHAALLSADQIDEFRAEVGLTRDRVGPLRPDVSPGRICARVGRRRDQQRARPARPALPTPDSVGRVATGRASPSAPRRRSGDCSPASGRGARGGRADRHDLPRRQRQHQPRRLDQQGRRVPPRGAAGLPRRRTAPAWKQTRRPAHRARHQRDEPVPDAARSGSPTSCTASTSSRSAPCTTRSCAAVSTP
jgi:hypothetical protein